MNPKNVPTYRPLSSVMHVHQFACGRYTTAHDTATSPAEIEEERRLMYVAMTRAKNYLAVIHPLRFFIRQQHRLGDRHVFTPRTRFIPDAIADRFARVVPQWDGDRQDPDAPAPAAPRIDVAARLRATWATPSAG